MSTNPAAEHYRRKRPAWFTTNVVNRLTGLMTQAGVGVRGMHMLEVQGRRSGQPRKTPVNVLDFEGSRYLVAPRGETEWVRNLRASGHGKLLLGRHVEGFTPVELSDEEKVPVLRAYLRRWKLEVGAFFDGLTPDAPDEEFSQAAAKHPVFRLT